LSRVLIETFHIEYVLALSIISITSCICIVLMFFKYIEMLFYCTTEHLYQFHLVDFQVRLNLKTPLFVYFFDDTLSL